MAAIFTIRRGVTNASPSLVEAELYLHQGSGSIQFGSGSNTYNLLPLNTPAYGDINLIGNISASGDVKIGGNIFLGDNLANDSVNVNSPFSGSIIPSGSNIFDLGSEVNVYRNVYATSISGAIAATNGVVSGSLQVIGILNELNSYTASNDTINTNQNSRLSALETASGSVINRLNILEIETLNLELFTSSINTTIKTQLNANTVVSGSSQVVDILSSLNSYTASNDTTNATQNSRLDQLSTESGSAINRLNALEQNSESLNLSLDKLHSYTQSLKDAIDVTDGNTTIKGNLTIVGTTTAVNSTTLNIADKNIVIASGSTTSAQADGAGITIDGAGVSMSWDDTNQRIELNKNIAVDGSISSSTIVGIGNVTIYSASVDSRLNIVEASASLYFDFSQSVDNRLDLLENTSSYLKGEFSESVDSRLDNLEAYTASADSKFSTIADVTASVSSSIFNLNLFTQSADGKFSTLATYTGSVETRMVEIGVVTGSLIISASAVSQSVWHLNNFTNSYYIDSASFDSRINTLDPGNIQDSLTALNNFTQSANGRLTALESNSSSVNISIEQLNSFTSSINTTIKDKLNVDGVLSGSAQIIANLPTGVVSGSSQIQLGSASGEITLGTQTTGSYVATITGDPTNGLTVAGSGVENAPVTLTLSQNITTNGNVRFNSIGVGIDASSTTGRIDAVNDVVAFSSSDIRFKNNIIPIQNALDKVQSVGGYEFDWNGELKSEHGYDGHDIGVIAQEIEKIAPELVTTRDNGYKAVKYEKIVPILIEAIKELAAKVKELEKK
jgi:hypothetical protein